MSKASEITAQLIAQLELIKTANGFNTDVKKVYPFADIVPDGAALPCILVSIDSDTMEESVGVQAKRMREFDIQVVFKRGATQSDLDDAHIDVLRALGFGKYPHERVLKGLVTDQQEAVFDMASQGSNFTSVTVSVSCAYVENYC